MLLARADHFADGIGAREKLIRHVGADDRHRRVAIFVIFSQQPPAGNFDVLDLHVRRRGAQNVDVLAKIVAVANVAESCI